MTTSTRVLLPAAIAILITAVALPAAIKDMDTPPDLRLLQERTYQGKPLTFWLQVLRGRDAERLSSAFAAIHSLGPDAWIAVPDLTKIVAAPFSPIRIGSDSTELIAEKLLDVTVRTEAIETLAWIGEAALPSTTVLIQWGLTPRVLVGPLRNMDERELFVELVMLDAEQRMRVAGAVAGFGTRTSTVVAGLLTSPDASKRKMAVAILSQDALPVATELLRSPLCEDREIGLLILKDMDLIVAEPYLDELSSQVRGNCRILAKLQ
jgi:hypothetical protein